MPYNIYERAQLAGGNLLAGDVAAGLQSVFQPQALSPAQMRKLENAFDDYGKRRDNPIIKTIKELGTDPFMWIGIGLHFGYKAKGIMSAKRMQALMLREGIDYARDPAVASLRAPVRAIHPMLRWMVSPITALRDKWDTGVLEYMLDVTGKAAQFQDKHHSAMTGLMAIYQQEAKRALTKRDWIMVDAYLRGMHKPIPARGGELTFFPDLEKKMSKPLKTFSGHVKKLLETMYTEVYGNRNPWTTASSGAAEINLELLNKGVAYRILPGAGKVPAIIERMGAGTWLKPHAGFTTDDMETLLKSSGTNQSQGKSKMAARLRVASSEVNLDDLNEVEDLLNPIVKGQLATRKAEYTAKIANKTPFLLQAIDDYYSGRPLDHIGEVKFIPQTGGSAYKVLKDHTRILLTEANMGELDPESAIAMFHKQMVREPQVTEEALRRLGRNFAGLAERPAFSLNMGEWFPKYARSASTTYAFTTSGIGKKLDQMFAPGSREAMAEWQMKMYDKSLRPMLRGMRTPIEMAKLQSATALKVGFAQWLQGDSPFVKHLSKRVKEWTIKGLEGSIGGQSLGGQVAGALYVSTLGGNISPVWKNTLQNFITTANFVGPRNMLEGGKALAPRLSKFKYLMFDKKLGVEQAFAQAFPEYHSQFGFEHTLSALAKGDMLKEIGAVEGLVKAKGQFKTALMTPFAVSEKFNRLWAFYSTREWARAGGVEVGAMINRGGGKLFEPKAAEKLARNITLMSQFGGGAIGAPQALRHLNPVWRQFAHFPARYAEWLYNSMAMGEDPTMRSFKTIGNTMISSSVLYHSAKNLLGTDLSAGLWSGALPVPSYEGSAFYPLPVVPPLLSIAGDVVKMGLSGDYGDVGKVASMAVPGGLAARRAWRAWAPRYAGYEQRTADGQIPIYNDTGSLIKYETPVQLALRGIGVTGMDKLREQEMTSWLQSQRDQLRLYRRNYAEAVVAGDLNKIKRIRAAYQKKYPQLPPLEVKKSDLTALRNRKEITRIQRILKTMPVDDRPVFEQAVNMAITGHMGDSIDQSGTFGFQY